MLAVLLLLIISLSKKSYLNLELGLMFLNKIFFFLLNMDVKQLTIVFGTDPCTVPIFPNSYTFTENSDYLIAPCARAPGTVPGIQ